MTAPKPFIIVGLLSAACLVAAETEPRPSADYLWYQQPALVGAPTLPWGTGSQDDNVPGKNTKDAWESQTLPIGNGRMGGTIFGGDKLERVTLNEVSLWTGGPNLPNNGSGYAYGPTANRDQFGSYQPFGNLYIRFSQEGATQDYSRSLDLRTGIADVQFKAGDVRHHRECFVSKPHNVLVYSAAADKPGNVTADIAMTPYHTVVFGGNNNKLHFKGTLANGEKFEALMLVRISGGSAKIKGKTGKVEVQYEGKGAGQQPAFSADNIPYIHVEKADKIEVYICMATDYKESYKDNWKGGDPGKICNKAIAAAAKSDLSTIRDASIKKHRGLFDRVSLDLGKTDKETAALPTDKRLAQYRNQPNDPELEATAYQYGRYVLIAGTSPENLPLNLQGIWNDKVHAAWACDYHNNINLQMCYWGAEVGNLSENHLSFINFIKAMEEPLHIMTQKQFGSNTQGWTTRISQNPWGGGGWSKWNPPVNAWYALHVWDHYLFTQNKGYLKSTAYPILKNISQFWESHLKTVGKNGQGLMSGGKPLSIEQHPELAEIKPGSLVSPDGWSHEWGPVEDGCMHDQQLIWELFDNTAKAAKLVGDGAYAKKLTGLRDRLVGNRIASGGYLQEWIVDRPNMVTGHRHTSHLIGVFPGSSISMTKTPDLAKAAMKSLELRGQSGDNRRSWTWPWRAALWARFGKTDKAYEMVRNYLTYNVLDNLFGNHPPMQMDGTYGITGGISEMLLQSHEGMVNLLPALPQAWKDGAAKGIRARGNITVNMEWRDGKVTSFKLLTSSAKPRPVKVKVNGEIKTVTPSVQ